MIARTFTTGKMIDHIVIHHYTPPPDATNCVVNFTAIFESQASTTDEDVDFILHALEEPFPDDFDINKDAENNKKNSPKPSTSAEVHTEEDSQK